MARHLQSDGTSATERPSVEAKRRHVFILDFDLYNNVGGGQSAYRRIIEHSPENTYYYLASAETDDAARPPNTRALRHHEYYLENKHFLPGEMTHFYRDYFRAWSVARSVREALGPNHFDVIDIPDYSDIALFARGVLAKHGITADILAIALHGTLEKAFGDRWSPSDLRRVSTVRVGTSLLYRSADVRYALSERYMRSWQRRTGIAASMIDPLVITGPVAPVPAAPTAERPTIAFIARLERWKGPDIFVDLAWCLRENWVDRITVFGSEDIGPTGVSSSDVIRGMAARRGIAVELAGSRPQAELRELFRRRTVLVVSSQFDTFNLTALEALRLGVPTFVSREAGVADWILANYPELSDLVVDFDCSREAALAIRNAVDNYDVFRQRIAAILAARPREADFASLSRVYDGPAVFHIKARQTIADIQSRFDNLNRPIPRPGVPDIRTLDAQAALAAPAALAVTNAPPVMRDLLQAIGRRRSRVAASSARCPVSDEVVERIRASGLFDEVFYLTGNPDVADTDPVRSYLEVGASEGRDPNPLFDTVQYLNKYADVAASGLNPLVHYLNQGASEGRDPHPLFHTDWYLQQYPDVAATSINPLVHYLGWGGRELRNPNPLFDCQWYASRQPAVVSAGINPLAHYILVGAPKGDDPHPLFDTAWYRRQACLDEEGTCPLTHYFMHGRATAHSPHPLFDAQWYLDTYVDVAATAVNPLVHYLDCGAYEGRNPSPDFDSGWYLAAHPDVAAAWLNPLVHFANRIAGAGEPDWAPQANAAAEVDPNSRGATWSSGLDRLRETLLKHGEYSKKDITAKLGAIGQTLSGIKAGRATTFRDMARLARKRRSDVLAATYCLRVMRWLGADCYGDLPYVVDTLTNNGYAAIAEAADAMYGVPNEADARIRALLDRQEQMQRSKPDWPLVFLDDHRSGTDPTVAVIVSLYNAEDKLPKLLNNLAIQSLTQQGMVEIVLVDSNSPTNEVRVFQEFAARHAIPMVYARSEKRETIQAAWNRGIKLARAPYLSFLGADEGIHPDCLEILATALDRRPDVDWVMANSIMTTVDRHGRFVSDVMTYNRAGYHQQLVQLETCYLSWVGGLYRKSIHTRFGYYDETFRGAGDTEFKSRILRNIKTLHIPKVLGVFNNFPDERTTESPMAELEDLRAWYLHRTKAGIAYSYDDKPIEDVIAFFKRSLGYRKSYQDRTSTDFDMASAIADYLCSRPEQHPYAIKARRAAQRLLKAIRAIELTDFCEPAAQRAARLESIFRTTKALEAIDAAEFDLEQKPVYEFVNDNRFEQHWWPWKPA